MYALILGPADEDRAAIEAALDGLGQPFTAHADVQAAEAACRDRCPELLILACADDASVAFCRRFRATYGDPTVVLAVVRDAEEATVNALLGAQVDDCILSPVRSPCLAARLRFMALRVEKRSNHTDVAAALFETEARTRAILDTTVDGIITIDERGTIATFNAAAAAIFGYDEAEVIGRNISTLMPAPYREEHDGYLRSYQETGHRKIIGIGREVRGLRKDGTTFPMDLAVSEVNLDGKLIYTGIVRDVTERRRLEQEILRISEQERRRIGQDLHDGLGQMLTGIGLISQNLSKKMAAEGIGYAEAVGEIAGLVKEADQQARTLARGLVPVALHADGLPSAILRLVKNAERLFGITCIFEDASTAHVYDATTASHLYRIVQESVSNAVRHGKASSVRIAMVVGKDLIRIRVQDDGIGIAATEADVQGMGVRIMHHRARIIGGTLEIRPGHEGGTIVICTVPLVGKQAVEEVTP